MRYRKWAIGAGVAALLGVGVVYYAALTVFRKMDPYIREQAILYLRDHFSADLEIASLEITLPTTSRLKLWMTKGSGAVASVKGQGIKLRRQGRPSEPPLVTMRVFSFQADLGHLFEPLKRIQSVTIDGLEVNVPPKGDRAFGPSKPAPAATTSGDTPKPPPQVMFEEIRVNDAHLVLHSRDPKKRPFEFAIARLFLRSVQMGRPMLYTASLENPLPPGHVESNGTFGPWRKNDPGATELAGVYTFTKADLSVFKTIGGILESTGKFQGTLAEIHAKGEAVVPEFYLKMSGNRLPLRAKFSATVDGTNGNTVIEPVQARLANSAFTTSGSVIKHEYAARRAIDLRVNMPAGRIEDFLRLVMKGNDPLLTGKLHLLANIGIPPLAGKVVEKLRLKGTFDITAGLFLKSTIQSKIDELSRRGQGDPKNEEIDEVVSNMSGEFTMADQLANFTRLAFGVPGADVNLTGNYDLLREAIDMRGTLKLKATVSQTQSGWKRIVLRPADPFFKKDGAGTFLKIRISGTRTAPSFGLDRGK
ncbi:MAG: hypothetical protein HY820_39935 [Acidobacteria bacterium]|nr:hypothetical protein [Acidobacteriota bacterium]